ncbi:MAG: ATP-binding protein [Thermodesulfovibrionales bacterium]|jgi:PAS domain S-box-containing protein
MPKLTIITGDSAREISFSHGSSVRELLDGEGIRFRSGCMGNGACGLCLVQIEAGHVNSPTKNERLILSPEQITGKTRLACQLIPQNDLSIRIINTVAKSNWWEPAPQVAESGEDKEDFPYSGSPLFEAFIKSTQYIVRLTTQQDIWDHLGKFITTYFPADWTAFVQRDPEKGISIVRCSPPDAEAAPHILTDEVRTLIADVLDSGFLASRVLLTPAPSMTVFLPIAEEREQDNIMLIGHQSADPLSKELLNIYLAIAGLAGATFERLRNERELTRHRAHLEELVIERTAELTKAKRQNELILHSAGEGICGIDLNGSITFINASAAQLIGWDSEELIGRSAHATFHHSRPNGCSFPWEECPVYSALKNGGPKQVLIDEFIRKDGTRFPIEFMTTPIMEEGIIVGAVTVFRDITERKQAEEKITILNARLRQNIVELEAANEDLESFSYSVSHDLRAPLRHMSGFLELLQKRLKVQPDEKNDHYMDMIAGAARKMGMLIDDLLAFSRIGRSDMRKRKVSFDALVRDAVQGIVHDVKGRDIQWIIGELPDIYGDQSMLRLVLDNLISNAVKFTKTRPRAKIEIGCKEERSEFIFFITDNGVGFDMEYVDKLFGVFQRLHHQNEFEGTGIGLANVQRIIARHGGKTWAEGSPGKGATFYFSIPKPSET